MNMNQCITCLHTTNSTVIGRKGGITGPICPGCQRAITGMAGLTRSITKAVQEVESATNRLRSLPEQHYDVDLTGSVAAWDANHALAEAAQQLRSAQRIVDDWKRRADEAESLLIAQRRGGDQR